MFNIYDYFYSKEVSEKFKETNFEFTPEEMVYIIYYSYKPIEFKIEGLKYISQICGNEDLESDILKIIVAYNNGLNKLTQNGKEIYYRLKINGRTKKCYKTFKKYKEAVIYAKEYIESCNDKELVTFDDDLEYKDIYSITQYDYSRDDCRKVKVLFNLKHEIISINSELIEFVRDNICKDLLKGYVKTPIVFENNGMKIVNIYNPESKHNERSFLLSNEQKLLSEKRDQIILNSNNNINYKKYNGPIAEEIYINPTDNLERSFTCINEFMNMYFVNEEKVLTEEQRKLQILRKIVKNL